MSKQNLKVLSGAGVLVTLGIIFGDIGTSPLYVLSAVMGQNKVSEILVYGGLSCIFWTLTLQTTFKYIFLTLQADNKGEGGIFSLYALVRKRAKWLMLPAIIGAGTLLADGIITPPISVSSAVEGLLIFYPKLHIIPIVIAILTLLFAFQRFGTKVVGGSFGPIMLVWFTMIGFFGLLYIIQDPFILKALSPYYAIHFLVYYPQGFWLLGAVFLATTGAEALYSDLGHCGKKNIRAAWIFVKTALVLNYMGQGAYLLHNFNGISIGDHQPFYEMMPVWFIKPGIIIATAATIIASQALISGSFTLVSEAVNLNFWPRIKIRRPTEERGQIYVPSINWMLYVGCVAIMLYFQNSSNMVAAYGFSITIAMMMTTTLLTYYMLYIKKYPWYLVLFIVSVFAVVESSFMIANVSKLLKRWFILFFEWALIFMMWLWYKGRKIKNRYTDFINFDQFLPMLRDLSDDPTVPKYASNLVYLTKANYIYDIETKIIYSIFKKRPKKADVYWFVHIDFQDTPYTMKYVVDELVKDKVFKVEFKIGFRVQPRVNILLRKVLEEMAKNNEIDMTSHYESLHHYHLQGDFRYVVLEKFLSHENELSFKENFILTAYFFINHLSISDTRAFGLDSSDTLIEKVPLVIAPVKNITMTREFRDKKTMMLHERDARDHEHD